VGAVKRRNALAIGKARTPAAGVESVESPWEMAVMMGGIWPAMFAMPFEAIRIANLQQREADTYRCTPRLFG